MTSPAGLGVDEPPGRERPSEDRSEHVLAAGSCVDGRYVIVRRIGRGGMGQVYEARHVRLGRRVALKILRGDLGVDGLRRRFEREAQAAAQIEHDQVVAVFDFGVDRGREPYLVMEYLDGSDLRALLRREGTLAAPRAVRLMHDACLGLAAAHAHRVIHRDIKPENLFVVRRSDGSETCKVLDFGLAKLRALGTSELGTAAGAPLGTLHYMSPEQARGDHDIDERTDVYACSAVLYEMLCGQRLHLAESPHALLYKIIHELPRRLEEQGAWLPPGLADVVHRGLEKDRELRLPNVESLRKLLARFVGPGAGHDAASGLPMGLTDETYAAAEPLPARASPRARAGWSKRTTVAALLLSGVAACAFGMSRRYDAAAPLKRAQPAASAATANIETTTSSLSTRSEQPAPPAQLEVAALPSISSAPLPGSAPRPAPAPQLPSRSPRAAVSAPVFDRTNPYD